jgi:hypothetical protein
LRRREPIDESENIAGFGDPMESGLGQGDVIQAERAPGNIRDGFWNSS